MKEKLYLIILVIFCSSISYFAGLSLCRNDEYSFMFNLALDRDGILKNGKNFKDSMDKYFERNNLNSSELHMKWVWKIYSKDTNNNLK